MNGAGSGHKLQQPFLWRLALNCNGAIATSGNDGIQEAIAIGKSDAPRHQTALSPLHLFVHH